MTPRGIGIGAIGAIFLAGGWALRWPAIALVGVVLLILVAAALRVAVRRVEITVSRSIAPQRVERRREAQVVLVVESRTGSPSFEMYQPMGSGGQRVVVRRIARRGRVIESRALSTDARGVQVLQPVEVRRADPFGFVEVTRRQCGTDTLVVTPRVEPLRPIDAGSSRSVDSPVTMAMSQGSMVFDRIREYVPGDDVRLIDWRATARTDDEPMVRQYVDTTLPLTVVVFDDNLGSYPTGTGSAAAFDEALDATASVIAAARSAGKPVELRLASGQVVDSGRGAEDPQMDALTRLSPSGGADLLGVVAGLRETSGGANLVILGGRIEPPLLDVASALSMRYDRVIACCVHPEAGAGILPAPTGVTAISVSRLDDLPRLWSIAVAV